MYHQEPFFIEAQETIQQLVQQKKAFFFHSKLVRRSKTGIQNRITETTRPFTVCVLKSDDDRVGIGVSIQKHADAPDRKYANVVAFLRANSGKVGHFSRAGTLAGFRSSLIRLLGETLIPTTNCQYFFSSTSENDRQTVNDVANYAFNIIRRSPKKESSKTDSACAAARMLTTWSIFRRE